MMTRAQKGCGRREDGLERGQEPDCVGLCGAEGLLKELESQEKVQAETDIITVSQGMEQGGGENWTPRESPWQSCVCLAFLCRLLKACKAGLSLDDGPNQRWGVHK